MNNPSFVDMPVRISPPEKAARVLPIELWRVLLEDWHNFQRDIDSAPPRIGPPGRSQVFFTDPESIFICKDASDFGERLGLEVTTETGCSVIFFNTQGSTVSVPQQADGATEQGLTTGGAREWIIDGNPQLDLNPGRMEAFEVEVNNRRSGPVG